MRTLSRTHRVGGLRVLALAGLVILAVPIGAQSASAGGVETAGTSLLGVSCWSAKGCVAVGDALATSADVTLAARWNGHSWTHLNTPNAAGAVLSQLNDVSCANAQHCVAVGLSNSLISIEYSNGGAWQLWQPPKPLIAILPALSCGGAGSCEVVGDRTNEHDEVVPVAEKWDGSSLTRQTSTETLGGELLSASCVSASRCMAVGSVTLDHPNALAKTLAEVLNGGSWQRLPTPNPGPAGPGKDDQLLGVSCATANSCMAVGQSDTTKGVHALAEAWNGHKWRVLKTPGSAFTLYGVSCPKVKICMAVGTRSSGTLAEKWNGKKWRVVKTPTLVGAFLNAVSCPKAKSCLAVGTRNNQKTLGETWNGKKWRAVKALKP
jgi:hypothetical protein